MAALVGDLLRRNARNLPTATAVVWGEQRLTYPQVNARVNRVAAALMAAGVGKGERVAVLARNSLDYFCLYFATAKIGVALVPLNYWLRGRQIAEILDDVEARIVFVDSEFAELLESALAEARERPRVVDLSTGWAGFYALGDTDDEPAVDVLETDAHMILYTSGTTGRAKGAILAHRRTMDDAVSMAAVLGVRQSDVYLNWHTPFHVGNWDHQKFFLTMGATVVLQPQFDAGEVLAAVPRERVTVLLTVPVMLRAMLEHPDFASTDWSTLRLLYYGAYDPSGIMYRTAQAFGADVGRIEMLHTYGLTEGGCIVTACPADKVFSHWGSIGYAIPGVEVRLLDSDGAEVEVGEPGEIWFRGPMMSGYWRRPAETAETIVDGWLRTGDVAIADPDGFLTIVDRAKDMIRSGGQNVYSKEVEDCVAGHDGVLAVAVIGLPDPVYEESVCAIVVRDRERAPSMGDDAFGDSVRQWVRERLAGFNTPRRVIVVDELPTTVLGKTMKAELRQRYGSMFGNAGHGR